MEIYHFAGMAVSMVGKVFSPVSDNITGYAIIDLLVYFKSP
jgi:hypothetical protein